MQVQPVVLLYAPQLTCPGYLQGMDMFGGNAPAPDDVSAVAAWEAEHCDDRIVVLADVWLDRPDTFDKLHAVLSGGSAALTFVLGSCKAGPSMLLYWAFQVPAVMVTTLGCLCLADAYSELRCNPNNPSRDAELAP